MNIKKGDILKYKNNSNTVKVQERIGDIIFLSKSEIYNIADSYYHIDELKNLFEIPEEKWVPEEGEKYYYPMIDINTLCSSTYFTKGSSGDKHRLQNGLCFKTPEEAIAYAKKMLEAINK